MSGFGMFSEGLSGVPTVTLNTRLRALKAYFRALYRDDLDSWKGVSTDIRERIEKPLKAGGDGDFTVARTPAGSTADREMKMFEGMISRIAR